MRFAIVRTKTSVRIRHFTLSGKVQKGCGISLVVAPGTVLKVIYDNPDFSRTIAIFRGYEVDLYYCDIVRAGNSIVKQDFFERSLRIEWGFNPYTWSPSDDNDDLWSRAKTIFKNLFLTRDDDLPK